MNGTKTNESPETTIGARDDPLAANKFGVALYPLRDQFRMFKHIGFGVDYAGDYDLVGRQLDLFKNLPLVLVLRIRTLERISRDIGFEHRLQNFHKCDVVVMRSGIIAPSHVQPNHYSGQSCYVAIDCLYFQFSMSPHAVDFLSVVPPSRMSDHRYVGAIKLENKTGFYDGLIFLGHGIGDGPKVVLVGIVVFVRGTHRHTPRRLLLE